MKAGPFDLLAGRPAEQDLYAGMIHSLMAASVCAGTDGAVLARVSSSTMTLLAGHNALFLHGQSWSLKAPIEEFLVGQQDKYNNEDVQKDNIGPFRNGRIIKLIIYRSELDGVILLIMFNYNDRINHEKVSWNAVSAICESIRFQIMVLKKIYSEYPCPETDHRVELKDNLDQVFVHESTGVTENFLLSTLVKRIKIHSLKGHYITSLRSWRGSIKNYQVSAFRALKTNPPETFVNFASNEISQAVNSIFVAHKFDFVVNVPCGYSGSNCFCEKLAMKLANDIQVDYIRAFSDNPSTNKSHPKSHASRPKMSMINKPYGNVLLVDDVVTTGNHMMQAYRALTSVGCSVQMLAWVGT